MSTNEVLEIKLKRTPESTAGPSELLLPLKHGDSGTSMGLQLGASSYGSKLRSQGEKRSLYFPVITGVQLSFTPYHPDVCQDVMVCD